MGKWNSMRKTGPRSYAYCTRRSRGARKEKKWQIKRRIQRWSQRMSRSLKLRERGKRKRQERPLKTIGATTRVAIVVAMADAAVGTMATRMGTVDIST
jgi:hypothetical protein